jgi:hypothetical protein
MDRTGNDTIVSTPSTVSLWTKLGLSAASVAAVGAVFGAFYLGTVFSNAPRETNSVATAETTGSASPQDHTQKQEMQTASAASAETSDAANCREQTWPYIARPCLANEKDERGVRVISTDKLADPVIGMVEAPPDAMIGRKAAPPKAQAAPAPAAANTSAGVAALKSGAALGAITISPAAAAPSQTPEQPPEPSVAASPPPIESPPPPAEAPTASPQPAAQAAVEPQAAPDKRIEKSKRKTVKRKDDRLKESDRFRTATTQSDDEEDEPVVERRSGRIKGRIVERWTERDYDVRSEERGGTRRVVVTDRDDSYGERMVPAGRGGGFPNIFGAIFGNN